ncbi:uncharacterized protein [Panulirus ornatus]|uniref:uncharacterized protein n=1 Tax=Panulirus ornatus TaxID=150431 RepID=UPI003A8955BE
MTLRGPRSGLGSQCVVMVVVAWVICVSRVEGSSSLLLQVTRAEGTEGPEVEVTWKLPGQHHQALTLTWDAVTYTSQVTFKEVGNYELDPSTESFLIKEGLKYDRQYRVCLVREVAECEHLSSVCSFVRVPRIPQNKAHTGPWLYLVLGPVHSKNLTVVWGTTHAPESPSNPRPSKGFRITWRRVEGRVGHPGHASNLVSSRHLIRGLIPGTRYEVCVGETLTADAHLTCDVITTAEDVPGPPVTEAGSCRSQAQGTHWRCDVTWMAPEKTHGRITGYLVEWKDKEGYVLMESVPKGTLCQTRCYEDQVVNFLPSEVCVSARTRAGLGWESCVPIHDVSERILAFFELKVLVVIGVTLVLYQLGPALLRAIFRCCVRGLYRHIEGQKEHPV